MKKNICVLTQPLCTNYGGLLQAYALQKTLRDMGHDVKTDSRPQKEISLLFKFLVICKRVVYKFILFRKVDTLFPYFQSISDYKKISENTQCFIDNHIDTIDFFEGRNTPNISNISLFDTYIVGSDQVWRPQYSPYLLNYFLDFISEDQSKRKIAYAASFGVSEWEFNDSQTRQASQLAKLFDAISLREDSGVQLCEAKLGVNAVHVLDPTLLLSKDDYIELIEKDQIQLSQGNLMTYVLDETPDKNAVIDKVATVLSLKAFKVMPKLKLDKDQKHIDKCVYPKVTEWLRGFMDAEFVVTDSFHGTVFSIIFNKPFIAIANKNRGVTRFISLLKIFGLENRLIYSINELSEDLIKQSINFNGINNIKEAEIVKSITFIANSLQ